MPIKLNWTRGRNLGLALIFLSLIGFLQVIFIIIAQYGMKVGSQAIVIFVPMGVTLALFYAIIIIFESKTSISKYREARTYLQKKKSQATFVDKINWPLVRPFVMIVISFGVLFGLSVWASHKLEPTISYVISSNIGAIGSLLFAAYIEADAQRKTR
jgi:hypothetical protein